MASKTTKKTFESFVQYIEGSDAWYSDEVAHAVFEREVSIYYQKLREMGESEFPRDRNKAATLVAAGYGYYQRGNPHGVNLVRYITPRAVIEKSTYYNDISFEDGSDGHGLEKAKVTVTLL